MHAKKAARMRRSKKVRAQMRNLQAHRLCINRTPRHIYAQVISPDGDRTIVSASTTESDISREAGSGGNISAAVVVGRAIAERAKSKGVTSVAFDRSGFKYHGRIKALADAARENGLEF